MICQLSADDTTDAEKKDELDTGIQIIKESRVEEKNDDDKELELEQKRYLGSSIGTKYDLEQRKKR